MSSDRFGTRASSGKRFLSLGITFCLLLAVPTIWAQVSVLTNKGDNTRSGQNASETMLTQSNVNSSSFGKLGAFNVDGYVNAQPLYMPNLTIASGTHNVLFVATQHDSVYALDADTGTQYWQASFINGAVGVSTVPGAEQGCTGVTGFNEVGVLGTPVIDPVSGTLYVTAKTKEVSGSTTSYVHRLHALDIYTGLEKFGGPVVLTGTYDGVTFDPLRHLQRPGLLLSNGTIYIGFGSNGCDLSARGWVMAYDATTLQQKGILSTQPDDAYGSSVWQAGVGFAADSSGYVYLATGNGLFNIGASFPDYGDSVLKLSLGAGGLTVVDYFTPFDQANMQANDLDLGSAGVVVLPDQPGPVPHLLLAAGKGDGIYLLNRDNLGQYNPANNGQIVQYLPNAMTGEYFGSGLFWNNTAFFLAHQDYLKAFSFSNGLLSTSPVAQTSSRLTTLVLPTVSGNAGTNGIVWLVRNVSGVPLLSAYNANTLSLLYDSGQVAGRDTLGVPPHFTTVTVANGKVFVGTQTQLVAYGLLEVIAATGGNNQTGSAGATLPVPLQVTVSNPYNGVPQGNVPVTFSDKGAGGSFSQTVVTTDSSGHASTTYTLPATPKTVTISATSAGYAPGSFTETASAGNVASIALTAGGKQVGTVGTTLPTPLTYKAKDALGNGVAGVPLTMSDGGKGGRFSQNPIVTGTDGKASVTYTLPTKAGFVTVTATSGTVSGSASEQAVVGPPTSLNYVSGNKQTAHPNTTLNKALVVSIKDQYGNAISGLTVTFTDNGAGGTFSTTTPVTNGAGQASVTYTTGPNTGTITITASYPGLTSVNFTETVK